MINSIAVGFALGLIGIGVIGMAVSGIRNVINGNSDFKKVAIMIVPVIIFAVFYGLLGTFNEAGVATMIVMMALMAVGIVVTGTRGTFKF
jgi:diacylglycerol kinase